MFQRFEKDTFVSTGRDARRYDAFAGEKLFLRPIVFRGMRAVQWLAHAVHLFTVPEIFQQLNATRFISNIQVGIGTNNCFIRVRRASDDLINSIGEYRERI